MSIISAGICALFLLATISAIPAPSGHVLSAVIHNKQDTPVRCTIRWESIDGPLKEIDLITINAHETKTVAERNIDMGSWAAFAFIRRIQCGDAVLVHPFQGVPSLQTLWNFEIESNGLVSAGPTEPKPENP